MSVLITGSSGFLGSWIVRDLAKSEDVTALVRPESNLWRIEKVKNLKIFKSHSENWPDIIRGKKPNVLILNDWWGVGNLHRNDERQFENLDRFKLNVDAALESGTQRVIGVGSQAELGPTIGGIEENHPNSPTTKYGEAKVIAHNYLRENIENHVWFRIFSTYGAMDNSDWLIPMIFNKLKANERVPLTYGEQIWSYLHAYDLSQAMYKVLNSSIKGAVNVGNPQTLTIKDAAVAAADYFGKRELLDFGHIPYREDQVMELKPITTKLSSVGWSPTVSFEEGIRHTYDWMSELNSAQKFKNFEISFDGSSN